MGEEQRMRDFVAAHEAELQVLTRESHLAYWESATTGDPEAAERYAAAEARVKKLHSDRERAARVKRWLSESPPSDPLLRRQLALLDLRFTGNLLPEETIDDLSRRAADLERVFHTFRARLDGEQVTNNQLREILREERNGARRREAWEASKQIAFEVAEPLRELVRRRNAAARSLGFADFYAMSLELQEQDEARLFALLEEFRARSEAPFRALRAELDAELSARNRVSPEALRPWHWEDFFCQEAPGVGEVELDRYFADLDQLALARDFFAGIGLPVDAVLERSDLWEREGKAQHAFCIDVDRAGDVRVLCNLRPDEFWTMVLLHELGHAVYDFYVPPTLPFLLREPAHTLSTEAIAMLMGRLTRDPAWLTRALGIELPDGERDDIARQLRLKMLVSARWMLVMAHFERALYRDPDRTDLDTLWWDLVERMQLVRRPDGRNAPDWAAKIHLSSSPVYYHNYLLGEWMASQLTARLRRSAPDGGGMVGEPGVGEFLREKVFAPGASLDWDELLVHATGEPLSPRYFVEQFVDG